MMFDRARNALNYYSLSLEDDLTQEVLFDK